MQTDPDSRLVRVLCRLYAVMMSVYPSEFRRRFGGEMRLAFRQRARVVVDDGGLSALMCFAFDILADWVPSIIHERIAVMRRQMTLARWIAALPLAILCAAVVPRSFFFLFGYFFVVRDFNRIWITTSIALCLMATVFVVVGVSLVPSRKDAVARIAVSVVAFWSVFFAIATAAVVPFWQERVGGYVASFGILLGGVLGYVLWRWGRAQWTETSA